MTEHDARPMASNGDGDDAGTPNVRRIRRPEAVAVALRYEHESGKAPTVVAGGRGAVAEQILELAFELGIKVREDSDLAQILSTISIDCEIPPEAFAAVAEILIYVYRANGDLPDFLMAQAPSSSTPPGTSESPSP